MTLKEAAAAFSVSPATAHRWWHRWLEASEEARATLSCLFLIARASRSARRGSSRPSSARRSAIAVARPVGGRGLLPARPASATRPFGRCSSGPASHGRRVRHERRATATRSSTTTHGQAVPAAHQRESGTLASNDGARMGVRTRLPITPRTTPSPATLAHALQHRPHSSLGGQPSTSRIHNVRGQDI